MNEMPTEDLLPPSMRLTGRFLSDHPRYRETLGLTPEHYRFDRVVWRSGVAALRQMLAGLAGEEGIEIDEEDLDRAVANLVEGVMREADSWGEAKE